MNKAASPSPRRSGLAGRLPRLLGIGLALAAARIAVAADLGPSNPDTSWTQYRGPRHDGTYRGAIRTNWSETAPRRLWRISAHPALSSLTVGHGRLYTQARRPAGGQDREFAIALDAATGVEVWSANLDLADYPNGGVGDDDGPRSTPVVDGDRIYVFTTYLRLHCLDAATGRVIWQRDFPTELGSSVINWQNAASPVVVGDLIYVNGNSGPNRLMAIRKSDGTTAWRRHDERMTQATPIHAVVAGVPQVIFFTQPSLIAVRPDTGELLWRYPFRYSTSTAASPVVLGDSVYCSAAYGIGSAVVRITATGGGAATTASRVWDIRGANQNHWATPVEHDGHVYGVFGSDQPTLRCVDAATGGEKWRVGTIEGSELGYGSILKVGSQLLVQTASGRVALIEPSPSGYRPLQSFRALQNGKCWNSPAIADGILYTRSTLEIAAYDLAPPAPPQPPSPLRLSPALDPATGTARITARATDGSALAPSRIDALRLEATADPSLSAAPWLSLPARATSAAGAAVFEDPGAGTVPRRFYRTRE